MHFELVRPRIPGVPVLVEVPHSGLAIPEGVADQIRSEPDAILRDADLYVDKLYVGSPDLGATLLSANVSRYVVDLNRAPDDVDALAVSDAIPVRPGQPRGVIWRVATDGKPVLRRPLTQRELRERIESYYTPYHELLRTEIERLRREHGYAIVLAAHSMPSVGRVGHTDPGSRRADVVPGTRGRTSADARLIDLVDAHFRTAGLSVRHDDPYRGGFTTGHYGRPDRDVHVVQIELNRALYMDETTFAPMEPGFSLLQAILEELVASVARLRLR